MLHHCHPTIGIKAPPSTLTFDRKNDSRKPHQNQQITKRAYLLQGSAEEKVPERLKRENCTTAAAATPPLNLRTVSGFLSESEWANEPRRPLFILICPVTFLVGPIWLSGNYIFCLSFSCEVDLSSWRIIHSYYIFCWADMSYRVFTHLFRVSLASGIFYSSQRLHMEVNTSHNYHNINIPS